MDVTRSDTLRLLPRLTRFPVESSVWRSRGRSCTWLESQSKPDNIGNCGGREWHCPAGVVEWQTHWIQNPAPLTGMWVRLPPSALGSLQAHCVLNVRIPAEVGTPTFTDDFYRPSDAQSVAVFAV